MNRRILKLGLTVGLGCSLASANVSWTWSFAPTTGPTITTLANGTTAGVSTGTVAAGQTLAAYGVQEKTSTTAFSTTSMDGTTPSTNTLSGLFYVNDSVNDNGTGIGPFNPQENGAPFSTQDGITNNVVDPTSTSTGPYQNLVLLKITGVSANETISFLMQAGVTGDAFNLLTDYNSTEPTLISQFTAAGTAVCVDSRASASPTCAGGNNQPTLSQISINTGTKAGTLWVAIQGDCHYLLLDTVSGSLIATPEPRFYEMLLAGLLVVPVTLRRRFAPV